MKHLTYLKTKPAAYIALEKRIDALNEPGHALRELGTKLNDEADRSREAFKSKPSHDSARAWVDSYVTKKEFIEGQFIQAAHSETSHAQSSLRREPDSFAIYQPILARVAELLREDIEDNRVKISKQLAEIDTEFDVNSIKPLPALRAKLKHVESLIEYCAVPSQRTDSLVDQINSVINGNLPEPATPPAPRFYQGAPVGAREPVQV